MSIPPPDIFGIDPRPRGQFYPSSQKTTTDPAAPTQQERDALKAYLRIVGSEQDDELTNALQAAEQIVIDTFKIYPKACEVKFRWEQPTTRVALTATPTGAIAADGVKAETSEGSTTYAESSYDVYEGENGMKELRFKNTVFIAPLAKRTVLTITAAAGFAATPAPIKVAIHQIAAAIYERRGAANQPAVLIPPGARTILRPYSPPGTMFK